MFGAVPLSLSEFWKMKLDNQDAFSDGPAGPGRPFRWHVNCPRSGAVVALNRLCFDLERKLSSKRAVAPRSRAGAEDQVAPARSGAVKLLIQKENPGRDRGLFTQPVVVPPSPPSPKSQSQKPRAGRETCFFIEPPVLCRHRDHRDAYRGDANPKRKG